MKLFSSSRSISSSSSSSVSFHPNMCTPKSTTSSCLAGILRRILCSRALPTHPSDHITEDTSESCEKNQIMEKIEDRVTAPIVVRLMGLDSVPDSNPSSVSRSRWVNSTGFREQDAVLKQGKHQTLNPTLSFMDMPVFFEFENEEFLVLRFGTEKGRREVRLKERNRSVGSGDLKQRKRKKDRGSRREELCKKKDDPEDIQTMPLNVLICEEMRNRIGEKTYHKANLKGKTKRNLEFECSSEDSSPVSVLDFDDDQVIVDQEVSKSEEEPKTEDSVIENNACQSPWNDEDLVGISDGRENMEERANGLSKRNSYGGTESKEGMGICRLIEDEVRESSWFSSDKFSNEEVEDIAADFGMRVLDELLDEMLLQFFDFPLDLRIL